MATASVAFAFTAPRPPSRRARARHVASRARLAPVGDASRSRYGARAVDPNDPPERLGGRKRSSSRSRPSRARRSIGGEPRRAAPDISSMRIAVGAGPCGLTTALALRHHGARRRRATTSTPRASALGAAFNLNGGAAVLEKLGLLSTFRRPTIPCASSAPARHPRPNVLVGVVSVRSSLRDPTGVPRDVPRASPASGRRARVRDGDARGSPNRARSRTPSPTTRAATTRSHGRARARVDPTVARRWS